jgi:hypothetical protein
MDIDKILDKHKKTLLRKFKNRYPTHLSPESIIKFVENEWDLNDKKQAKTYDALIEHLAVCDSCKAEIKHLRAMLKDEETLSDPEIETIPPEAVQGAWKRFNIHIKKENAVFQVREFLRRQLPDLERFFQSAWETIKDLPSPVEPRFLDKELAVSFLADTKDKPSQILVCRLLLTVVNLYARETRFIDKTELSAQLSISAKQTGLPKKIAKKLTEFILAQDDEMLFTDGDD